MSVVVAPVVVAAVDAVCVVVVPVDVVSVVVVPVAVEEEPVGVVSVAVEEESVGAAVVVAAEDVSAGVVLIDVDDDDELLAEGGDVSVNVLIESGETSPSAPDTMRPSAKSAARPTVALTCRPPRLRRFFTARSLLSHRSRTSRNSTAGPSARRSRRAAARIDQLSAVPQLPVPQDGSKQAAYPLSQSKKYSCYPKKLAIRESGPTNPSG